MVTRIFGNNYILLLVKFKRIKIINNGKQGMSISIDTSIPKCKR